MNVCAAAIGPSFSPLIGAQKGSHPPYSSIAWEDGHSTKVRLSGPERSAPNLAVGRRFLTCTGCGSCDDFHPGRAGRYAASQTSSQCATFSSGGCECTTGTDAQREDRRPKKGPASRHGHLVRYGL